MVKLNLRWKRHRKFLIGIRKLRNLNLKTGAGLQTKLLRTVAERQAGKEKKRNEIDEIYASKCFFTNIETIRINCSGF